MEIDYNILINEFKTLFENLWKEDLNYHSLQKGEFDIVTETDLKFEQRIISKIKELSPDIPILSEETLSDTKEEGTFFTIDPVDGTWNFANGVPIYGTQVALIKENEPVLGIIFLPTFKKMFTAVKGEGAFCNGKPISVRATEIQKSMISITDFKKKSNEMPILLNIAKFITNDFGKPRMNGCTSYDLAMVSQGSFQGKIAYNPYLWDIAPGMIIIKEAGGFIKHNSEYCIAAASEEILKALEEVVVKSK